MHCQGWGHIVCESYTWDHESSSLIKFMQPDSFSLFCLFKSKAAKTFIYVPHKSQPTPLKGKNL